VFPPGAWRVFQPGRSPGFGVKRRKAPNSASSVRKKMGFDGSLLSHAFDEEME